MTQAKAATTIKTLFAIQSSCCLQNAFCKQFHTGRCTGQRTFVQRCPPHRTRNGPDYKAFSTAKLEYNAQNFSASGRIFKFFLRDLRFTLRFSNYDLQKTNNGVPGRASAEPRQTSARTPSEGTAGGDAGFRSLRFRTACPETGSGALQEG